MVRRDRRGVILYLLAVVAVMVGLFMSILHYSRSQNRRQFFSKREKSQAQFLARGAQQHFLLKLKFLMAHMYEAAGFSVGRNPYFDFGGYLKGPDGWVSGETNVRVNPMDDLGVGPLFYTGGSGTEITMTAPTGDAQAPAGSVIMVVDRSKESTNPNASTGVYSGPAMPSGSTNKYVMSFPLEHFLVDVCTDFPPSPAESVVRFYSRGAYKERASMGSAANTPAEPTWRDPLTGFYFIEDFKILGQGGGNARKGKKYEADSVVVFSEADVLACNQVSPITVVNGLPKSLDTVSSETQARLVSKPGGSGWPEIELSKESDAEFQARVGDTNKSAHRTEIVTATYLIRRPR